MREIFPASGHRINAVLLVCVYLAAPAGGLVLHPDAGDLPADSRPADAVVGRWSSSASCVAISPTYVITTKHQYATLGQTVVIGGQACEVAEYYTNPSSDLRIARLATGGGDCDLEFVDLYRGWDEEGKVCVLGGYGVGRGETLTTGGIPYAYGWADGPNATQRWGRNRIEDVRTYPTGTFLLARFDGVCEGQYVDYEAALADHDSGSGWFLNDAGTWKLAGVGSGVERLDESRFNDKDSPVTPDPDDQFAVRISACLGWIEVALAGPAAGDADCDNDVDHVDLGLLASNYDETRAVSWSEGDFSNDGIVNYVDLGILASTYGFKLTAAECPAAAGGPTVPEPACLLILGAGAAALCRRRRAR